MLYAHVNLQFAGIHVSKKLTKAENAGTVAHQWFKDMHKQLSCTVEPQITWCSLISTNKCYWSTVNSSKKYHALTPNSHFKWVCVLPPTATWQTGWRTPCRWAVKEYRRPPCLWLLSETPPATLGQGSSESPDGKSTYLMTPCKSVDFSYKQLKQFLKREVVCYFGIFCVMFTSCVP